jgi:hypothetical protein
MKRIVVIAGTVAVAGTVGLGAAVAYADSSPTQSPKPTPTPTERVPLRLPIGPRLPGQLPAIDQMLHGEAVGKDANGAIKTYDWQNGQVTAVSGSSVTVRSSDGTTWTWTLNGDTKVRKNDKEDGSASDLATGDKVVISGTRAGDTRTTSMVVDPAPDFSKVRQRLENLRKDLPRLRKDLPGLPGDRRPGLPSPPA